LKVIILICVGLSSLYWIGTAFSFWLIQRKVTVLEDEPVNGEMVFPMLSIIKPACNEGIGLDEAMASVLLSDYPFLEIILVDDRSTDDTPLKADQWAQLDSRVKVIHLRELPEGWLGKVHALYQGVKTSQGDWILFSDADVHLNRDTLKRAVSWAESQKLDFVGVLPQCLSSGYWVDSMVSVVMRTLSVGTRIWEIENPQSRASMGVGAFNLVRRRSFDKTPGFEWLKLEVADDAGLGLMMKQSGAHCSIANGRGLVTLHWYHSVNEFIIGLEKGGFANIGMYSHLRLWGMILVMLVLELTPLVLFLAGPSGFYRWVGAFLLLLSLGLTLAANHWFRRPLLPSLASPLGLMLLIYGIFRSGILAWKQKGIYWRGTFYPTAILKTGKRFRFP